MVTTGQSGGMIGTKPCGTRSYALMKMTTSGSINSSYRLGLVATLSISIWLMIMLSIITHEPIVSHVDAAGDFLPILLTDNSRNKLVRFQ
jgi:hypothetical protein